MTDKVEKFLSERTPIYIDNETALAVLVNTTKLKDTTWAEIFFNLHYPWINTARGYLMDDHLILYVNDYEIPNVNVVLMQYLFTYFPDIKWIGLGCIKGEEGEEWKPRLVVRRNNSDLVNENKSTETS